MNKSNLQNFQSVLKSSPALAHTTTAMFGKESAGNIEKYKAVQPNHINTVEQSAMKSFDCARGLYILATRGVYYIYTLCSWSTHTVVVGKYIYLEGSGAKLYWAKIMGQKDIVGKRPKGKENKTIPRKFAFLYVCPAGI